MTVHAPKCTRGHYYDGKACPVCAQEDEQLIKEDDKLLSALDRLNKRGLLAPLLEKAVAFRD